MEIILRYKMMVYIVRFDDVPRAAVGFYEIVLLLLTVKIMLKCVTAFLNRCHKFFCTFDAVANSVVKVSGISQPAK